MKHIEINYNELQHELKNIILDDVDYTDNLVGRLQLKISDNFLSFIYPGWESVCKWDDEVIDGIYYITRIGREMFVDRPGPGTSEWRLKEKAEGEFEIKNGEMVRFRPHYPIFSADHMKRIRRSEAFASQETTPNPHYYE